jgi:hypothetical protein
MEAVAARSGISAGTVDDMARAVSAPAWQLIWQRIGPPVYRPQSPVLSMPRTSPKPPIVQARFVSGQPPLSQPPGFQAKIYPNLNASAAIPVDRDEIFQLHSFFDNYRITRGRQHGQLVANSKYIFCRMTTGQMLLHPSYRHPAIAAGRPVLYAGEAYFDNGKLAWWSNGSGNYRPDAEHAAQAELPMDRFYTYQDVLRGKHKERTRPGDEFT